jgi:hypothetical protein
MRSAGKVTARQRGVRATMATLAIAAIVAVLAASLVAACGSTSVAGTYKYESGSEKAMAQLTLTLNDDGSFELAGPNPAGGADITLKGTYTTENDKLSLKMTGGSESEVATVEGDKLVFPTVTWVKQ